MNKSDIYVIYHINSRIIIATIKAYAWINPISVCKSIANYDHSPNDLALLIDGSVAGKNMFPAVT